MWSSQSGIVDERKSTVISRRRTNLHGKLITSSYVYLNASSRTHLMDFVDKHVDSILKLNYMMVNTILDSMNVTKKELFQMTWGYYNARSRKWSGMVGDLVHNGADIGGKYNNNKCWFSPCVCDWVWDWDWPEIYDFIWSRFIVCGNIDTSPFSWVVKGALHLSGKWNFGTFLWIQRILKLNFKVEADSMKEFYVYTKNNLFHSKLIFQNFKPQKKKINTYS